MSTAIALVWAYIAEHPEQYASWVAPFTQLRWCASEQRVLAVRVGGHWRRQPGWSRTVAALQCVCHFERLVRPKLMSVPMKAVRMRWDENGFIPRIYRVLCFA